MDRMFLAPPAVLILWTLAMLIWMAATRFPAMKRAGIDLTRRPGGRGQDLEGVIDPQVNWKAHNYAHLMEQPTLFYAVVLILFALGATGPLATALAWLYVALRIVHSIWQATVNRIRERFALFALSTLCLLGLAVLALLAAIGPA